MLLRDGRKCSAGERVKFIDYKAKQAIEETSKESNGKDKDQDEGRGKKVRIGTTYKRSCYWVGSGGACNLVCG